MLKDIHTEVMQEENEMIKHKNNINNYKPQSTPLFSKAAS